MITGQAIQAVCFTSEAGTRLRDSEISPGIRVVRLVNVVIQRSGMAQLHGTRKFRYEQRGQSPRKKAQAAVLRLKVVQVLPKLQ